MEYQACGDSIEKHYQVHVREVAIFTSATKSNIFTQNGSLCMLSWFTGTNQTLGIKAAFQNLLHYKRMILTQRNKKFDRTVPRNL